MKNYIRLVLLLIIIALPIFSHLDMLPVQEWDESRLADNATELLQTGSNPLVPTFEHKPDMWNTKPPLMIWMQMLSMKIVGVGELGLRLPSALAAVALCMLLYWFFAKKYNKPMLGFIVCIVLVTSRGYVCIHGTRTGDYDSLLALFTTAYCLFFFLFLEQRDKIKYLYLFFLCITLAVLTKSIAGILFAPALGIYVLALKQNRSIFKSRHLYIGLASFIGVVAGYYLLREHYNPGYLKAVWENELGGRYNTAIETHEGKYYYYMKYLVEQDFLYWYIPMFAGIIVAVMSRDKWLKKISLFSLLLAGTHLYIISSAKTKLGWYALPEYPWLSVLAGVFIYVIYKYVEQRDEKKLMSESPVAMLFMVVIFYLPYTKMLDLVVNPPIYEWQYENINMAYFLKDAKDGKHSISGYKLIWDNYNPNLDWYRNSIDYGKGTERIYSWDLSPGDTAAVAHHEGRDRINRMFNYTVLKDYHGVTVYRIDSNKP